MDDFAHPMAAWDNEQLKGDARGVAPASARDPWMPTRGPKEIQANDARES